MNKNLNKKCMKSKKLTDSNFKKELKIKGGKKLLDEYMEGKIFLYSKQIDICIDDKNKIYRRSNL